jgi:hypothetical protein
MAAAGVAALVMADRAEPPEHLVFTVELIVRQSCGCPPAAD